MREGARRSSPMPPGDQVALRAARTHNRRAILDCRQLAEQREAAFTAVLAASGRRIGDHDGRRSGGRAERARRNHPRGEVLHRRRLPDVEGLSRRDPFVVVDQAHLAHAVARRKRVRERAAQRSRSNDRDKRHQ